MRGSVRRAVHFVVRKKMDGLMVVRLDMSSEFCVRKPSAKEVRT